MTAPPVPWHRPIVVTRHEPAWPDGQPYITLTTPLPDHALLSDELLHQINNRPDALVGVRLGPPTPGNPEVLLHQAAHNDRIERLLLGCVAGTDCWLGWYLHLNGRNISATYRIDNYGPANAWRATRWQD